MDYVLCHHGIKGQKWGIRRFQNEDGSLTPAGIRRYGVGNSKKEPRFKQVSRNYTVDIDKATNKVVESKTKYDEARKEYEKTYAFDKNFDKVFDKYRKAEAQRVYAKQDLKIEKIKQKINNEYEISKHREKLEEHYKSKGMNDEEAAIAAYKRAKTEKILLATAGLTVAAIGAYAIYKHHDTAVDKFIEAGSILKRVARTSDPVVHDGFYAVLEKDKGDVQKYAGMLAKQLQGGNLFSAGSGDVFQKNIQVKSGGLKIASEKTALNALKSIVEKDQSGLKDLKEQLKMNKIAFGGFSPKHERFFAKAISSLEKGKIDKNVYRGLNFLGAGEDKPELLNKLFTSLKDNGYGGIVDINDKYLSGYGAKNPLIIFDSGKTFVSSVNKLSTSAINTNYNKAMGKLMAKKALTSAAKSSGLVLGTVAAIKGGTSAIKSSRNDKIVSQYHDAHPNTNMTYTEIIRAYEEGRIHI